MDVEPDNAAGMAENDPNKIQQELQALQRQRRQVPPNPLQHSRIRVRSAPIPRTDAVHVARRS